MCWYVTLIVVENYPMPLMNILFLFISQWTFDAKSNFDNIKEYKYIYSTNNKYKEQHLWHALINVQYIRFLFECKMFVSGGFCTFPYGSMSPVSCIHAKKHIRINICITWSSFNEGMRMEISIKNNMMMKNHSWCCKKKLFRIQNKP